MPRSNAKRPPTARSAATSARAAKVAPPAPPAQPAEPRVVRGDSLSSQIAQEIRQDILLGRLRPGSPVAQQALCEQYGTSRMPVRDALRQLSSEGLVINTEQGRAVIAPLTVEDFEDSFLVEALAHSRAARRAATNATSGDLDRLEALNREMVDAGKKNDSQRVAAMNWRFHGEINRLARSSKLTAILRTASSHIPREYLVVLPNLTERSQRDHDAILAAMRKRDGAKVEKLVHAHVSGAGRDLVDYLRTTGALTGDAE